MRRPLCDHDHRTQSSQFTSNNRATGTAEENKAVVGKSIAHFGPYSIDQADKTITFRMEKVTFPNWDGTEQKRNLIISGDEMKYVVPVGSAGGVGTVTWKRVK